MAASSLVRLFIILMSVFCYISYCFVGLLDYLIFIKKFP
jgi:hypothetical protein